MSTLSQTKSLTLGREYTENLRSMRSKVLGMMVIELGSETRDLRISEVGTLKLLALF